MGKKGCDDNHTPFGFLHLILIQVSIIDACLHGVQAWRMGGQVIKSKIPLTEWKPFLHSVQGIFSNLYAVIKDKILGLWVDQNADELVWMEAIQGNPPHRIRPLFLSQCGRRREKFDLS